MAELIVQIFYIMVDPLQNQPATPRQVTGPGNSLPSDNNLNVKQEAEKLKKELEQRAKNLKDRQRGASRNLQSSIESQREYNNSWNVFRGMGGEGAAHEKQIKIETKYKEKLDAQLVKEQKTQKRVQELMSKGEYALAKAVMEGKEQEYKQQMSQASKQVMQGLQDTNKQLQDTDKFLGKVETGMVIARNTCVIAAATVATGGTAGALMAGYGTVAGGALAIGVGTVAGTTVGGLSNFARAGVDENYSATDAVAQTITDAKSSAIAAASAVTGAGVAGKIIGKAGGEAVSLTTRLVAGSAAGGTGASVSTAINTTEQYVRAQNEFKKLYGDQNIPDEQKQKLYEEFMRERRLGGDQIVKDAAINIGIGMVSGGQGAKAQAARDATGSVAKKILITTAEATGSSVAGLTGSALKGQLLNKDGSINVESVMQETISSGISSYIGGVSTKQTLVTKGDKAAAKQHLIEQFTTAPTLGLLGKKIPPPVIPKGPASKPEKAEGEGEAPPTSEPTDVNTADAKPSDGEVQANSTETKPTDVKSAESQKVEVPKKISESPSYKAVTKKGEVEVILDDSLPAGVKAQAEVVVEKDGSRKTIIKVDKETAEGIKNNNSEAIQRLHEEIDHANQKTIDPIIKNPGGTSKTMSEAEYTARRAFQEVTAESSSSSKVGGEKNGDVLAEMKKHIDAGNYEEAIRLARLSDADVANYKSDYENNVNPNREKLIQRSNAVGTMPRLLTIKQRKEVNELFELYDDASPEQRVATLRECLELADGVVREEFKQEVRNDLRNPRPGIRRYSDEILNVLDGREQSGSLTVAEKVTTKKRIDEPHTNSKSLSESPGETKLVLKQPNTHTPEANKQFIELIANGFKDALVDSSMTFKEINGHAYRLCDIAISRGIPSKEMSSELRSKLYEIAFDPTTAPEAVFRAQQYADSLNSPILKIGDIFKNSVMQRICLDIEANGKVTENTKVLIDTYGTNKEIDVLMEQLGLKTKPPAISKPETKVLQPEPQEIKKPDSEAASLKHEESVAKAEKPQANDIAEQKPLTTAETERLTLGSIRQGDYDQPCEVAELLKLYLEDELNQIRSNGSAGDGRVVRLLDNLCCNNFEVAARKTFGKSNHEGAIDPIVEARRVLSDFLNKHSAKVDPEIIDIINPQRLNNVNGSKSDSITAPDSIVQTLKDSDTGTINPKGHVLKIRSEIKEVKISNEAGESNLSVERSTKDFDKHQTLLNKIASMLEAGNLVIYGNKGNITTKALLIEPDTMVKKPNGDQVSLVCIHGQTNSRIWGEYNINTGEIVLLDIATDHNAWDKVIKEYQSVSLSRRR